MKYLNLTPFLRVVGLAILLAAANANATDGAAKPVEALDLYRLEQPLDPQLSPDGRTVAVLRQLRDIQTDRVRTELWLVAADDGERRLLVGADRSPGNARWSPDGKSIALIGKEGSNSQLLRVSLADGRVQVLSSLRQPPRSFAWSPDSQQIAFVALVERKAPEFFELPKKPEGAQWANAPRIVRDYPYRADGEGWLVAGDMQLFVLELGSGRQRQLTSGPGDWGARDEAPAWLPDGQSIIVSADTDPAARRRANEGDLWQVSLREGEPVQRLTKDEGFETSPAVSPDGRSLAYVGWRKRANSFQRTDVFLLPLDSKQPARNLTASLDRNAASPRWREDGSGIHFLYQDEGVNRVGLATLAGQTRVLVPQVGNTRLLLPSSSGGTYSAAAGRFVYPSVEADRPATLALWSDSRQLVLWDMNSEWRADKLIGQLEEIRIPSKADRRSVHGWILYPPNFDPSRRYPLALDIHGGPHLDYGPMFSITHQLYAAAGYVVLFVNPRGSIGYGEEFASLIHLAYPGRDHDDLMSAVDSVVARGFIDPRRLYIGGGSGGGVLSSWAIGKTDRFAAAAVKRPVINWASTTLTTDIGALMGQYWFERMPWEQPEKYWARSPLSLVGKVTTPTLIITGEEDWRTPMSDSEQYFQALQLRGVDSALMRLPEASHGFGRPSQWLAAILGTIGWYDKHRR